MLHPAIDHQLGDGKSAASQRDNGQERWEKFRNMGLVGAAEAEAWSKEIWRAEAEDEDEDED
jgi:hypothetical protein